MGRTNPSVFWTLSIIGEFTEHEFLLLMRIHKTLYLVFGSPEFCTPHQAKPKTESSNSWLSWIRDTWYFATSQSMLCGHMFTFTKQLDYSFPGKAYSVVFHAPISALQVWVLYHSLTCPVDPTTICKNDDKLMMMTNWWQCHVFWIFSCPQSIHDSSRCPKRVLDCTYVSTNKPDKDVAGTITNLQFAQLNARLISKPRTQVLRSWATTKVRARQGFQEWSSFRHGPYESMKIKCFILDQ